MRFTTLSSVALLIPAIGCEPVQPGLGGGPAPMDGEWRMHVVHVDSIGRCGMLRDSDLEGLVMGMEVATRDDWGIRFDIEGMELKGNMDSGQIYAQGRLIEEQVVVVSDDEHDVPEETEVEEPDHGKSYSEGDSARTPDSHGEDQPMRHGDSRVDCEHDDLFHDGGGTHNRVCYSNAACVLILDFEATHMNDGADREEPIIETSGPPNQWPRKERMYH